MTARILAVVSWRSNKVRPQLGQLIYSVFEILVLVAREVKMLQPDIIRQKLPDFARILEQRHAPLNWEDVLLRTSVMLTGLGKNNVLKAGDYSAISQPCMVMLGDRDKMVGLEETLAVYNSLPNGQLAIIPSTKHPIEFANIEPVAYLIGHFLETDK